MGRVALVGIKAVDDEAKAKFRHLPDKAFRDALVRRVAVIDQKNDLDVSSAQCLLREVQEAVAIGVLQADRCQGGFRFLKVEGVIDRGIAIVKTGA